jgi:EAL domain-containing protein (putative c-di-GMP-specific phosphodiesterase class I)
MQGWCLERVVSGGLDAMVPMVQFPFVVGRDSTCDLTIPSGETSRQHARIDHDVGGLLRVTDLNSGNGTFINHVPIHGSALIADGDVVHFGGTEFRVRNIDPNMFAALTMPSDGQTVIFSGRTPSLSDHFVLQERQFTKMLADKTVRAAYQPIVSVPDGQLFAFEVLGRGCVADLPASPMGLFELATRLDKEVALSEAFRWAGLSDATMFAPDVTLFVNAHPKEVFAEAFYRSIATLRAMRPSINLVVEVHETAVARIDDVRAMADRLSAMQVRFAYDDFGAGQARLLELAEVPPHFVKFDMGLIRGIDSASAIKQQLVSQLVRIVHDVGATALAEGVETAAEARVCVEIGFDLIQGYFTGKPELPEDGWADTPNYVSQALRDVAAFLRRST